MKCKTGVWLDTLDADDTASFAAAQDTKSRVELHGLIAKSENNVSPFSLTVLKDHILGKCVCYRQGAVANG